MRIWAPLQTARISWNGWGQLHVRRLFCTSKGCGPAYKLFHEPCSLQLLNATSEPWWQSSCSSRSLINTFFPLGFIFLPAVYPPASQRCGWLGCILGVPSAEAGRAPCHPLFPLSPRSGGCPESSRPGAPSGCRSSRCGGVSDHTVLLPVAWLL